MVDSSEITAGGSGTVLDGDGLLSEVVLVAIVLTVYLVGVVTDRRGRVV